MATTTVTARVDSELTEQAGAVLAEIGLSLDDAVSLLLRQIVAEHCLPFVLHQPNQQTIDAIRESEEPHGRRYTSLDQLFRDMRT